MGRAILGVVVGAVVAIILVVLTDVLFHAASAVPAPSPGDAAGMRAFIAAQPAWLMAVVTVGWALAALVGSLVATGLARRGVWPGYVVTALMLAAIAANFVMFPHPGWMVALALVLIAAGGLLGTRLATRRAGAVAPGAA